MLATHGSTRFADDGGYMNFIHSLPSLFLQNLLTLSSPLSSDLLITGTFFES
jgi:hypothetical protein